MSGEYSENLALFTRPQGTYTEEQGEQSTPADSDSADFSPNDPQLQREFRGQYQNEYPTDVPPPEPEEGRPPQAPLSSGPPDPGLSHEAVMFNEVLGTVHEKALSAAGFGRLQWTLFVVLGLGIMGDGIELLLIAFVLPGAEQELCLDGERKGWLGAISFAGMMGGAILWGNMADKIGRRVTITSALIINAVFSIVAAFVPSYWMFLTCRLLSGVGIGGSIPVVFAYFAEFCPLEGRGQKLGLLLIFWVSGGIYVSGLGWLIIPQDNLQFMLNENFVFSSWRVFMLICTIPILLSILGLLVMPESPRFLLQAGKDLEALGVYRKIYKWNHTEAGAEYEMPEIELPNRPMTKPADEAAAEGQCQEFCVGLENAINMLTQMREELPESPEESNQFWNSIFQLFFPPLTQITIVLSITWFSIAFGYYGLTIWFPEYMKKLQEEAYFAQRELVPNATIVNKVMPNLLDNIDYLNATFINVTFKDILLQHVTFERATLRNCIFQNATARKTYFYDSSIHDTMFNDTNFFAKKFKNTELLNVNFTDLDDGCDVDFDLNFSSKTVFLENFIGQLSVVPGTIITALLVDKLGRIRILAGSLFMSGVSVFFIWFTDTEVAVVAINCIFNFCVVGSWNSLDIVSTELYPTQLRTTAFGFQSSLGRIAAILGNVVFGTFIQYSKAIPILITAAIMALGGSLAIKLPESKHKLM